jgi:hypothetical protein
MFWTFGDFIDPDTGEIREAQGGSYTIVMDPDSFTRPLDGRTVTRQRTASCRRLTG